MPSSPRFLRVPALVWCSCLVLACEPATPGERGESELLDIFPAGEREPARAELASAAFEQLKALAGNWEGIAGDFPASAKYEVLAEGTIVLERLTVEDPIEMVTVYRLDRGRLVAEHFCMAGNQPRLYLDELSSASSWHFTFAGATNLASPSAAHMRGGRLALGDDGELLAEWLAYQNGEHAFTATISLRRQPSPAGE